MGNRSDDNSPVAHSDLNFIGQAGFFDNRLGQPNSP
jgi:hypothetical protein